MHRFEIQPRRSTESSLAGLEEFWNELWKSKEEVWTLNAQVISLKGLNHLLEFKRIEACDAASKASTQFEDDSDDEIVTTGGLWV